MSTFAITTFQLISGASLIALFAGAVNCDQKLGTSTLKHIIGTKQFDFVFKTACGKYTQHFWIKMIGAAAYVKACGTSQRTDCMTFAPFIAISLGEYGLLVLKTTNGRIGIGFCNLIEDPRRKTKSKDVITGNAMIMIRDDNIQHVEIEFYGKHGVRINNFGISFESTNLSKNDYDNPLVLVSPTTVEQKQEAPLQPTQDLLPNTYQNYASQPSYASQPNYASPFQFADYNSISAQIQFPNSNMYGVGPTISNLSMPLIYPGAFSVAPMIPPLPIPSIPISNNNQLNQQNNPITYLNTHESSQQTRLQRYSPY